MALKQSFLELIGYGDPNYGKDICIVWSAEFMKVASPYFGEIAMNAMVFIPLFTIWRSLFEYLIHREAIEYAESQQMRKVKTSTFDLLVTKYKESYWKSITTSVLMFYGFYFAWHNPCFWNPNLLFNEWPQNMGPGELIYYRMAIGYHGHRAIFGLFYEEKRKDYLAYTIHHFATVLLIVFSWCCGLSQHGTLVMSLHDSADAFLAGTKICGYKKVEFGTRILFILFAVSWILFRLILYPIKVILPLFWNKTKYDCHPLWWFFMMLLSILYILHVYWGYFVCGYVWRMLRKPKSKEVLYSDPRSDDESESKRHKNGFIATKKEN